MNNLGKVKLLPAREQVASILRKAILSRELQEGQEITLEGIAAGGRLDDTGAGGISDTGQRRAD